MDKKLTTQIEEYLKNGGKITKCPDIGEDEELQTIQHKEIGLEITPGGYYVQALPSDDEQWDDPVGSPDIPLDYKRPGKI